MSSHNSGGRREEEAERAEAEQRIHRIPSHLIIFGGTSRGDRSASPLPAKENAQPHPTPTDWLENQIKHRPALKRRRLSKAELTPWILDFESRRRRLRTFFTFFTFFLASPSRQRSPSLLPSGPSRSLQESAFPPSKPDPVHSFEKFLRIHCRCVALSSLRKCILHLRRGAAIYRCRPPE
jgi:hypothetical protein